MPFHERSNAAPEFKHWPVSIEATYLYTAGVAGAKFFEALLMGVKVALNG